MNHYWSFGQPGKVRQKAERRAAESVHQPGPPGTRPARGLAEGRRRRVLDRGGPCPEPLSSTVLGPAPRTSLGKGVGAVYYPSPKYSGDKHTIHGQTDRRTLQPGHNKRQTLWQTHQHTRYYTFDMQKC